MSGPVIMMLIFCVGVPLMLWHEAEFTPHEELL